MKGATRNALAALVLIAVSTFWFTDSARFRELSRIFPRTIAVFLGGLAVLLLVLTIRGRGPAVATAEGDSTVRHRRSATLIAGLVIWTALIPVAGLLVASLAGVTFMGFITFRAHAGTKRAIIIAVISVVGFYLVFQFLLYVPFPMGFFQ